MSKLKNPLLSLGAVGRLTKDLVFTRRRKVDILEKKPVPYDAKSLAQLSWRHMYLKAVTLWHALSAAEKQEWESLARPKHMTGFAYFISLALKPNPGLYLPLQGGTMAGDIDMASHSILNLPPKTKGIFFAASEGVKEAGRDRIAWAFPGVKGDVDLFEPIVAIMKLVPDDYISFVSVKAVWYVPRLNENMYWYLEAGWTRAGDLVGYEAAWPPAATPSSGSDIINVQEQEGSPLSLTGLQAGDFLGLIFNRYGTEPEDTLTADPNFFGLLFTYIAKQ